MILSDLDNLLWAAGFLGNGLLLTVLLIRRRARHFPCFAAFIAGSLLRTAILFGLARHYVAHTYFIAYWSLAILVDVVLQVAVVYETAGHVFRPLGHWAPDARRGMSLIIAGSLLVASLLTALAVPASSLWQEAVVSKGNFFSTAIMSELLIGMVYLSVTVGLPWRTHVARIGQAFGAYSLLCLSLELLRALYGAHMQSAVDVSLTETRKIAYLLALGYWIVTLWLAAPAPRQLPAAARQQLRELQARLTYDLYTLRSGRRP